MKLVFSILLLSLPLFSVAQTDEQGKDSIVNLAISYCEDSYGPTLTKSVRSTWIFEDHSDEILLIQKDTVRFSIRAVYFSEDVTSPYEVIINIMNKNNGAIYALYKGRSKDRIILEYIKGAPKETHYQYTIYFTERGYNEPRPKLVSKLLSKKV